MKTDRIVWFTGAVVLTLSILMTLSLSARAQESSAGEASTEDISHLTAKPKRTFGFGTAFGGGFVVADRSGTPSPALLLPTLEAQFFTQQGHSVDVTVPALNLILTSVVLGGAVFTTDVFYNFNLGDEKGNTRCIIGPGLGFSVLSIRQGTAFSLRIPAELGVEILNERRSFGFKMMLRPLVEVAFGGGDPLVGGGGIAMLGFSGYNTTR